MGDRRPHSPFVLVTGALGVLLVVFAALSLRGPRATAVEVEGGPYLKFSENFELETASTNSSVKLGEPPPLQTCLADLPLARANIMQVVVVAASAMMELTLASPRTSISDVAATWCAGGYDVVYVRDTAGNMADVVEHKLCRVVRVVSAAELACLGLSGEANAGGIIWSIAAGARSVLDMAHPSLMRGAPFALPSDDVTLLPRLPVDALPNATDEHFTATLIERARRTAMHTLVTGAARRGTQLCVGPVLATLQLGLCHAQRDFKFGHHDTVAANSPTEGSDAALASGGAVISGRRLLEDVTPLALRHGDVAEFLGDVGPPAPHEESMPPRHAFPEANRLAGRDVAWALFPAPSWSRLSVALQLAVGVAGHSIVLQPPGRLCNVSHASMATTRRIPSGRMPHPLAWSAKGAAGHDISAASLVSNSMPLDGHDGVSAALSAMNQISRLADLDATAVDALTHWLRLAAKAFNMTGSRRVGATDVNMTGPTHHAAASSLQRPFAKHCYLDHPNVRDIVLVLNFNNYPRHASNDSANVGPRALAYLRKLYSPYFSLILGTADVSAIGPKGQPHDNLLSCNSDFDRAQGWMGGIVG